MGEVNTSVRCASGKSTSPNNKLWCMPQIVSNDKIFTTSGEIIKEKKLTLFYLFSEILKIEISFVPQGEFNRQLLSVMLYHGNIECIPCSGTFLQG